MTTDDKGHADLSVDLPEGASTRPLEAKLIVDVAEPGGRTVERTVRLPVRRRRTIGVRLDFDASLSAGDVASFEAIAVADGEHMRTEQEQGHCYAERQFPQELVDYSDMDRLTWPAGIGGAQRAEIGDVAGQNGTARGCHSS